MASSMPFVLKSNNRINTLVTENDFSTLSTFMNDSYSTICGESVTRQRDATIKIALTKELLQTVTRLT